MGQGEERHFCPACGDHVPTYVSEVQGVQEVRCENCGFPIGPPAQEVIRASRLILADDDKLLAAMVRKLLLEARLADQVTVCHDGGAFLTEAARLLRSGLPPAAIMLDWRMPVLNGGMAAVAFRAVEKAFDAKPCPILFFSAMQCDETLQATIRYCQPATYLNKAVGNSPQEMTERFRVLLGTLLSA